MTDSTWRPLGIDDDEQIAEYDALHDGVPMWMKAAFWAWVRESITEVGAIGERDEKSVPGVSSAG